MKPLFFETPNDFRKWLEENHQKATELLVGFYKVGSGKKSITWPESVDEALCFGWIDGIRRSIDEESYCNRFTPRSPNSNWSAINIAKVEKLIQQKKMMPAGLELYNNRKSGNSNNYSYESAKKDFAKDFEQLFKNNTIAWTNFNNQPPSYKKTAIHWVMSAKQEKTKNARLEKLILISEQNKRFY